MVNSTSSYVVKSAFDTIPTITPSDSIRTEPIPLSNIILATSSKAISSDTAITSLTITEEIWNPEGGKPPDFNEPNFVAISLSDTIPTNSLLPSIVFTTGKQEILFLRNNLSPSLRF